MSVARRSFASRLAEPQYPHDDHDHGELKPDPPAHQFLRPVCAPAAQQIEEAEKKDDRDGADANGNDGIADWMQISHSRAHPSMRVSEGVQLSREEIKSQATHV